jgi:hypothetical protein
MVRQALKMKLRRSTGLSCGILFLVAIGGLFEANARPIYAKNENKKCVYCHINPSGGERGFRGIFYRLHGHTFHGFVEKAEAAKAGVKPNTTGEDTRPTKSYPPPDG